ncbi:uncharacterized protein BJ212DRAFT_1304065 [Suillus subaureus]|uniref:Uncharacterized protein n=1 Tax=Suillus subaureus TaxID=48587 RepID=A0A9P7DX53_9AGAM|nr:uncharacterized protein BJ212DRAFT_1304065 [Suillus subaureus]KAG1805466.1 hypothetical protein BJ212DRAFT_1304065 [Suillus subaureus]
MSHEPGGWFKVTTPYSRPTAKLRATHIVTSRLRISVAKHRADVSEDPLLPSSCMCQHPGTDPPCLSRLPIAEERGEGAHLKFWVTYKKLSNEYEDDFIDQAYGDLAVLRQVAYPLYGPYQISQVRHAVLGAVFEAQELVSMTSDSMLQSVNVQLLDELSRYLLTAIYVRIATGIPETGPDASFRHDRDLSAQLRPPHL